MRIYGPFHALSNPLVMGVLALKGINDVSQAYDAAEQEQNQRFLAQSLLTGTPVQSMPGGIFRRLVSHTGLVSPDVQASPEAQIADVLAVRKQQQETLKQQMEMEELGFKRKSADIAERREQREAQAATPEAKGAVAAAQERGRLGVAASPEGLRAAQAVESAKQAVAKSAAFNEFLREQPYKEAAAIQEKVGLADALADRDLNTPLDATMQNKRINGVWVKRGTLEPVTGKGNEPKTVKDIRDQEDKYHFVPASAVKGAGGLDAARANIKKLDTLDALVDDVFPSTKGKNAVAASTEQINQGIRNFVSKSRNTKANLFYQGLAEQAGYLRATQGRFPNARELNIPLMPDPGDLIGTMGEGWSLWHPLRNIPFADSAEVAHQKIQAMRQYYAEALGAGALSEVHSSLPELGDVEPK